MYWLLKGILFFLGLLPYKIVSAIGFCLGSLAWYLLPSRRKVAIINAGIVGAQNPVKTAKLSFKHSFASYLELALLHKIDKDFVRNSVRTEGTDHVENLIGRGESFYLVGAHLGAWDLSTFVVSTLFDCKILVVGRSGSSKAIDRLLEDMRNTGKVTYLPDKGFINKVGEYLAQGCIPGSLLDHSTSASDSVNVPFFGLKVPTLAAVSAYCVRKKIPMLPVYLLREKEKLTFIAHPPLYPDETLKGRERITDLTARMNLEFERVIRQYPEQWYLLHKRFKKVKNEQGETVKNMYE